MKNSIYCLLLITLTISCRAQTVKNILEADGVHKNQIYYQDLNFLLNPFVGTYVLQNGNQYFKIILQKRVHAPTAISGFEDLIVGEYQYINPTGVQQINSLSSINTVYNREAQHRIDGNEILSNSDEPVCGDCAEREKRLRLGFTDNYPGYIIVRKIVVNGLDAISIFKASYGENGDENGQFTPLKVPFGTYVLIKQP